MTRFALSIVIAGVAVAMVAAQRSPFVPVCSSNVISLAKKPSLPSANLGVIVTGLNAGNTGNRGVNVCVRSTTSRKPCARRTGFGCAC